MHAIETNGLSKSYNTGTKGLVVGLKPLSLHVQPGEIFGLLGPNGAGKTTLIKLLLGIIHPTTGNATIFGKNSGSTSAKQLLGYLPENHRYPNYLTALQAMSFYGNLAGISGKILHTRTEHLLKLVSLWERRNEKIRKFSKGMLQRLGLAQALLNEPKIVFLDEPTDGIDPIGRKEIREILHQIKEEGTTIFLNSHLLSEVEMVSDRVAIMNKGELLALGSTKELTQKQNSYKICTEQKIENKIILQLDFVDTIHINDNELIGTFSSLQNVNSCLDVLRAQSHLITSVEPQKTSLEDLFFTLVQEHK